MATKCSKGKSCGASCVQRSKHCAIELGVQASRAVAEVRQKIGVVGLFEAAKQHKAPQFRAKFERIRGELKAEIGGQIRKPEHVQELKKRLQKEGLLPKSSKAELIPSAKPKEPSKKKDDSESPEEEWQGLGPKEYDEKLQTKKLVRIGDERYGGWVDETTTKMGEGSFARVDRNSDSKFVKRGIIGEQEAAILQKVGANDLGPGLVAAELNGKVKIDKENTELSAISHLGLRYGRIAMSRVPGRDLEEAIAETGKFDSPETKINGIPAADIYWKAMADLHRLGIAHNDAHPGNLFIGERTGKGRWVDFGLSQESSKAALAEGLGAFTDASVLAGKNYRRHMAEDALEGGNWQTQEWNVTGMNRVSAIVSKPGAQKLAEDCPLLARVRRNRFAVDKQLEEKYGLSPDEIAAIYAHGIRSPLYSYEQGPWRKLSEQDARDLIEVLYRGV